MHKFILGWAYTPGIGRVGGLGGKFFFFIDHHGLVRDVLRLNRKKYIIANNYMHKSILGWAYTPVSGRGGGLTRQILILYRSPWTC